MLPGNEDTADALAFVRKLLEKYGSDKIELLIVDIGRLAEKTAAENVICVPCLVIRTAKGREHFVVDLEKQRREIESLLGSSPGS
jgi:hypothetical protein